MAASPASSVTAGMKLESWHAFAANSNNPARTLQHGRGNTALTRYDRRHVARIIINWRPGPANKGKAWYPNRRVLQQAHSFLVSDANRQICHRTGYAGGRNLNANRIGSNQIVGKVPDVLVIAEL